jgi:2-octaprenylphenol hydroxylase
LQFKTKLVIAADGANSVIRDLANIELNTWEYHHTAIVSTVTFELSHQNTAWQCFLANGPLAFLPLKEENVCSIVWSTTPNHAKELLELNDKEFCLQLTKAFESRLGNIVEATKRFHFPLRMRHAKNYVKNNLVLIGDSAHTIHPLAGQGVNLGLSDAKVLAGVILEALQKNRDYSALHTLRKYERARKTNNVTMLAGIEMIKRLFCSESLLAKKVRGFGLSNVNRLTHLKNFFASYAMGK